MATTPTPSKAKDDPVAFQAMFEHVSMGIIVVDDKGVIQKANPYSTRLFGYSEPELVGQRIEILIPRKLRSGHAGHRDHYNAKPEPRAMGIGMDLWAVRKDGSEFPVEISLASYEIAGKREVVSFVNDITLRKKAEEALRRLNTELEEKVAARTQELSQALLELQSINEDLKTRMEKEKELSDLKSRFVSMASHEFRTPLGGILTSASLIGRYAGPKDQDKRERHLGIIKASVKNLTSILNDFLSLDKLEGGKVVCRPSDFNLSAFTTELFEEMRPLAKKGQRLLEDYHDWASDEDPGDGISPRDVFLDKDMCRNILINLISNAIKYSPEGTEIRLDVGFHSDRVVLTIQDQGIGIPEEDQKHLFGKFFRAKNALTVQGTGLGLNIVKSYLDLMGGSIEFNSREGKGTNFTVTLPKRLTTGEPVKSL